MFVEVETENPLSSLCSCCVRKSDQQDMLSSDENESADKQLK